MMEVDWSDSEEVAWVFHPDHAEWAAAGFRTWDQVEAWQHQGAGIREARMWHDPTRYVVDGEDNFATMTAAEALAWRPLFGPLHGTESEAVVDAHSWRSLGVPDPVEAHKWASTKFEAPAVAAILGRVTADEAWLLWRAAGFGENDPLEHRAWSTEGHSPGTAAAWKPFHDARFRQPNWRWIRQSRRCVSEGVAASETAATRIDDGLARLQRAERIIRKNRAW